MTSFPVLPASAYMGYVGTLSLRGANESTHLAEIRYPVQAAPVVSVVKFLDPDGFGVCNEAIAWLFLRAAGIQAPKQAAIVVLSEAKAVQVVGRKMAQNWLSHGHVLAWAAQALSFKSIRALFAGTEADEKWLSMLRTAQGSAVAAFDEVFLNVDRNLGNVLFIDGSSCVPIDHEMIFGRQNWGVGGLDHQDSVNGDSLRVLKRARLARQMSTSEFDRVCAAMVVHAERHQDALAACQDGIEALLTRLHGKEQAEVLAGRILSFVGARVAQRWLSDRLGVLS